MLFCWQYDHVQVLPQFQKERENLLHVHCQVEQLLSNLGNSSWTWSLHFFGINASTYPATTDRAVSHLMIVKRSCLAWNNLSWTICENISSKLITKNIVTFLKEIEDYKNRPGTKIYLERQENDEVVCSPAEQVPKAGWFFVPRHAKRAEGRKITQLEAPAKQGCTLPSHFLVLINKFESPTAGFYYPWFPLK